MIYIYLHGFGSGPNSQKAKFFKRKFKSENMDLIIPDLNGRNFTDLTITSQIKIIQQIMESFNKKNEKFILIGSSMGGYVSALCANLVKEYPIFQKIEKIILMAPAFEFSKRILKKDKEKFLKWKKEKYIEIFHYQMNKNIPLSFNLYLDARKYENHKLTREIPALIFHGIEDEVVPYEVSLKYTLLNRKSQLMLMHTDHSLLDQVDTIWEETKLFLGNIKKK